MLMAWKSLYYYILLLCGCFVIGLSPCLCRRVEQYRKVVRATWSGWALSRAGAGPFCLSVVIYSFVLVSLRSAAWLESVTPSSGPRDRPRRLSHDAGLDVLVGDLLVVVVRAAARWVHRRGRHGVEREDELLSVAHAWRLGMVPRNTCEKVF